MTIARRLCLSLLSLAFVPCSLRLRAEEPVGFKDPPSREIVAAPFTDGEINELVATLDELLSLQKDPEQWGIDAGNYLWTFVERLQTGRLTPAQETRVLARFDQLEREHPRDVATIEKERHVFTALTIGKTVPEIVGQDMDGRELRLSDYRGRVVVLTFSGEWCGACRAEYPYQRLLLELYRDRPFTLLGVNSDRDVTVAKQMKDERGLAYRSWWDGSAPKNTHGPIATEWGVIGWPTAYVLDGDGVIRFVNLRQEDLLKGVKQLMSELSAKAATKQTAEQK